MDPRLLRATISARIFYAPIFGAFWLTLIQTLTLNNWTVKGHRIGAETICAENNRQRNSCHRNIHTKKTWSRMIWSAACSVAHSHVALAANPHLYMYVRKSENKLYVPKFSTSRCQKSFKYHGAKIWNSIPFGVRKQPFSNSKLIKKKVSSNTIAKCVLSYRWAQNTTCWICLQIFFSFYFLIICHNCSF